MWMSLSVLWRWGEVVFAVDVGVVVDVVGLVVEAATLAGGAVADDVALL